jgi:hypothetical protein
MTSGEKRQREFCHSSLFAGLSDNLLARGNSSLYDSAWNGHAASERSFNRIRRAGIVKAKGNNL